MSRGPTRRVRRLVAARDVEPQVLARADHDADLLAHPYIDVVHLQLARLALSGAAEQRKRVLAQVSEGLPAHRWRPRGFRSAARSRGRRQTSAAQQRALAQQRNLGDDPDGAAPTSRA